MASNPYAPRPVMRMAATATMRSMSMPGIIAMRIQRFRERLAGAGTVRLRGRRRSSRTVSPTRMSAPSRQRAGRAPSPRHQNRRRTRVPLADPASLMRTARASTVTIRWRRDTAGSVRTSPRPSAPFVGTGRISPASGPASTARCQSCDKASLAARVLACGTSAADSRTGL